MLYVVASFNCKTGILEKDLDQTYLQYCTTNYYETFHKRHDNKILHIRQMENKVFDDIIGQLKVLEFLDLFRC